jgi:hypothetical protein
MSAASGCEVDPLEPQPRRRAMRGKVRDRLLDARMMTPVIDPAAAILERSRWTHRKKKTPAASLRLAFD